MADGNIVTRLFTNNGGTDTQFMWQFNPTTYTTVAGLQYAIGCCAMMDHVVVDPTVYTIYSHNIATENFMYFTSIDTATFTETHIKSYLNY